jgi:hypothetical protein
MHTIPISPSEQTRKKVDDAISLGIKYTDILVTTDEESVSLEVDEEEKAQLYFLKNPYPLDTLKEYLELAVMANKLDSAKATKLRELGQNPEVFYDLDELKAKNILDKSRKQAIEFISEFNPGEDNEL